MGIRIRKVLGYGLTNFDSIKTKPGWEDRFFDSEFKDLTGYVQKYIKDNNLDMNAGSKYVDLFFAGEYNDIEFVKACEEKYYNYIAYDNEGGDPNTIVFVPPGCNTWTRYDNDIDYYEWDDFETLSPKIKLLNRPIYPFINLMKMNDAKDDVETYWISCYRDHEDADSHIPYVPWSIKILMDFIDFSDDNLQTYFKLRPMIYTYFS